MTDHPQRDRLFQSFFSDVIRNNNPINKIGINKEEMKMKKVCSLLLALVMMLSLLSVVVTADGGQDPGASALPADILGHSTYATKTVVSFDDPDAFTVTEEDSNRCSYALADAAVGKGLKLTVLSNTCQRSISLKPDEEGKAGQNWSHYDGLLWWIDTTGLVYNEGQETVGSAIRATAKGKTSWTRNRIGATAPYTTVDDFHINAYYQANGEWVLCDESQMNGERLMVPTNYVGWVYVPFSSYVCNALVDGNPYTGVYGLQAVTKLMLLSGPYNSSESGASSIVFDEITVVRLGKTNEEVAAEAALDEPEQEQPSQPGQTYTELPANIRGFDTYATKSVLNFDEEGVLDRISAKEDRCTFAITENGANGNGLQLTSGSNTCEVTINLFPDEDNEDDSQNWDTEIFDGIMWWIDSTQITYKDDYQYAGSAIRVYSTYGNGYSWTRNRDANQNDNVLENFAIDAYYLNNGEWTLCDQSMMNGERVMAPANYVGWIYVPFTSYMTTKGSVGGPEEGIYASFAVNKIMLLTGPYQYDGVKSKVTFDEIQLVKLGVTNDELNELLKPTETSSEEESTSARPTGQTTEATPASVEESAPAESDSAPVSNEPTTTAPAGDDKKGCASTIGSSALLTVAVIGASAFTVRRKKHDD